VWSIDARELGTTEGIERPCEMILRVGTEKSGVGSGVGDVIGFACGGGRVWWVCRGREEETGSWGGKVTRRGNGVWCRGLGWVGMYAVCEIMCGGEGSLF